MMRAVVLKRAAALVLLALSACASQEPSLSFATHGGDAWTFDKPIEISARSGACETIIVESPLETVSARPEDGRVSVKVALHPGRNLVRARCRGGGPPIEQSWFVRLPDRVEPPAASAGGRPAWIGGAVVYGVVPYFFGENGFTDVVRRLDDLAALGVTVLWLSPITEAPPDDFGYAVTDHFRVRARFGTEADLRALVDGAHARGMRVILDFIPNHVSERHPYFQDAAAHGRRSPYFDFFVRTPEGEAAHYFGWENLKNLNYDHPEVRAMMIEAFAYWVRNFDVDGFRVDAAWGPRQRAPDFWPEWEAELRRIKPDLLLLAEASARDPYYFANGFDAAYDWTTQLGEWAWRAAFEDEAHTVQRLRAAIERAPGRVFRFLNNNDTGERFIARYGLARTRLAAALLLTVPGLPGLYTGDAIGAEYEPYDEGPPIAWTDPHDLRGWYKYLIELRRAYPALRGRDIRFLDVGSERVLAYVRPGPSVAEDIVVLLNFGSAPARVTIDGKRIALAPHDIRISKR